LFYQSLRFADARHETWSAFNGVLQIEKAPHQGCVQFSGGLDGQFLFRPIFSAKSADMVWIATWLPEAIGW